MARVPSEAEFSAWNSAVQSCSFPGNGPCGQFIESAAAATYPGTVAARDGLGADVNPHADNTDAFFFWYRGWLRGTNG